MPTGPYDVPRRSGWFGESARHALARKGIRTTEERFRFRRFHYKNRSRFRDLNKQTKGKKEWIADLDLRNGEIVMQDVQLDGSLTSSFMSWDSDDPQFNHGFIHYHPPGTHPRLTAQDYLLGAEVHKMKKDQTKPTYIGLVTDNHVRILAYLPQQDRTKELTDLEAVENNFRYFRQLDKIERQMRKNGETVRVLSRRV